MNVSRRMAAIAQGVALYPLCLSQGVSETCQFGFTQEPFATALAVFLDVSARIGAIGPSPCFSAQLKNFESRASVRLA